MPAAPSARRLAAFSPRSPRSATPRSPRRFPRSTPTSTRPRSPAFRPAPTWPASSRSRTRRSSSAPPSSPAAPTAAPKAPIADIMPGPGAAFLNLSKAINGCMLNAHRDSGACPTPSCSRDKTEAARRGGPHRPARQPEERPRLSLLRQQGPHRRARHRRRRRRVLHRLLGLDAGADQAGDRSCPPAMPSSPTMRRSRLRLDPARPTSSTATTTRPAICSPSSMARLEPARRRALGQASSTSTSTPSPESLSTTAWPTAASSTCPLHARALRPAASISPFTAAPRTARPSATLSSTDSGFARWADSNDLVIAVPAGRDHAHEPAGLLGLVGLHRPRLPDPRRATDHGRLPYARAACAPRAS